MFDPSASSMTPANARFSAMACQAIYMNGAAKAQAMAELGLEELAGPAMDSNLLDWSLSLCTSPKGDSLRLDLRGSQSVPDWASDLEFWQDINEFGLGLVHAGFQSSLRDGWNEITDAVIKHYSNGMPFFLGGHSLGGAHAQEAAWGIYRVLQIKPTAIYTFGCPRVYDPMAAAAYPLGDICYNFVSVVGQTMDIVPRLPPAEALTVVPPKIWKYTRVGQLYIASGGTISTASDLPSDLPLASDHHIGVYLSQLPQ